MDWKYITNIAKDMDETDMIQLMWSMSQVRERLDKGSNIDNITFPYEDEWFKKSEPDLSNKEW